VTDESSDKPETPEPTGPAGDVEHVDSMSPEAIAKRVAALGGEDEADRIAREEETKLAERRAKLKGGKGKKGGLEAAASKRLQSIGGKVPPKRIAYAANADAFMAGSGPFATWFRANQRMVTALGLVALIGLVGGGSFFLWSQRMEAAASNDITSAVGDEQGRIGDPAKEDEENAPKDPRPVFKTEAERRDAALAKYREVETKYRKTGAAYLARLEEGSLLLDKPDLDGAIAAFTEAGASPLAAADAEVKGRALEGLGFAYEAKAVAVPGERDKWLDLASQEFRALENTDVKGFKELGMYHQARIAEVKGDKDKAVQLLKSLHERLAQPGENHPFVYLETVADDRLRQLDPGALPPKSKGGPMAMPGAGAGGKMSEEQIQQLIEQLKHQQPQGGGAPPPAPAPVNK
jgi:hypothetical protein